MKVLVTGGAGYIGSHTMVELLNGGFEVVVCDNLINSKEEAVRRVERITAKNVKFYDYDLCHKEKVREIFLNEQIDAVIHFAGLKAVGESVKIPLRYYSNNILGTLYLLETMKEFNVNNIVFSSSATVYGDSEVMPLIETMPLKATSPYGSTKLMIETMLKDICFSEPEMNCIILRYFNPVGAHESGLIGENPRGIPNNLMPYISQVAIGKLDKINVFGNDYPTKDGTGVRDYIHVADLAAGHVKALSRLKENCGYEIYNLGCGVGYSVLEIISAFEKACGNKIKYEIVGRRQGDVAVCYSNPEKALKELGWKTERSIDQMCSDTWRWQTQNPDGY